MKCRLFILVLALYCNGQLLAQNDVVFDYSELLSNAMITNPDSVYHLEVKQVESFDLNDLCQFKNLQTLKFESTAVSEFNGQFDCLENLYEVVFYDNMYLTALPESLSRLTNLMSLDVWYAPLTTIPDLSNCNKLKRLDLTGTNISEFPKSICSITSLTYLSISGILGEVETYPTHITPLQNIPDEIANLINLEFFACHHTDVNALPSSFEKLVKLNWVDISATQIIGIPKPLQTIGSLEDVDLIVVVSDNMIVDKESKKFVKEHLPDEIIYNVDFGPSKFITISI